MRHISHQKQVFFDILAIASIITSIWITDISLSRGIYDVFPYFYLIPVVILAYSRPNIGVYITVAIGWMYIGLVYLVGSPDARNLTIATIWFFVFISLGVLISAFSREYHREALRSCGAYFRSQAGAFCFNIETLVLVETNDKFSRMLQYERDELKGHRLGEIFPTRDECSRFMQRIHDQHRAEDVELQFQVRDGTFAHTLLSAIEIERKLVICTVVDISSLKQLQDALQQTNRKLNLLNNVTRHDILNQLTGLITYLEISRGKTSDPAILEYIRREEQAAETIRHQIMFTRDYQNIGIHSPQWQNVVESVSLAAATIPLSHISLKIELVPVEIYADPLLEKVFYNLIENAIRHGDHVTTLRFTAKEQDDGLDIIVEDDGIGIANENKEKIFNREYFKNTGFGLFLSREILAITGLFIRENGEPGKGARFVIHAPKGTYRFL